ncbi:rab11 family-interacting protein 1 [Phaethornis superciliosus]
MSGPAPAWVPTHVQVTVLRARGLRAKAAAGQGGSDAYTVMALGREKFSTSVAERCQGEPLWREEATFELPPRPAALRLTVFHRALVGLDKFLGRAEVDLAALRAEGGRRHSRWYKLRSKPGKKEKERGEIEVDIQFMRSNMTASMFDLSMKDKPRSAFGKLKNKLKGKRSSGLSDTASAIIPSTTHSPADSEDEAVEKEKKKSKFKSLFSKPSLQKTSLSQSLSVLPTQHPSTQRVRLHPRDFHSEWDDEELEASSASERAFGSPLEEKSSPSPVFKSRKTVTLDSRQLNPGTTSHTKREGLSLFTGLKSKSDPASKSSLCINGTHVYMEESTMKDNTPASSPSPLNFRRKQLFASEENLTSRSLKGAEDPGRTSPTPASSGSSSLETFKSMTLPSYRLLSSEEYQENKHLEVVKETKKTDHKKPPLVSLVTGKKEAAKPNDAENIPNRTPQDEESKIPEEKSEHKHPDPPADVSRRNPPEDSQHAGGVFSSQQPLNPFEEEQKPEKAAALAKTKAVKPRLGLSSEEEPKATLPTLAPQSLPAFLSVHQSSSDKNPFLSKKEQKAQVPQSANITAPAASPPLAAEAWRGGSTKPTLGACQLSPGETEAGRAGGEVAPKPAPRAKHPVAPQTGGLSAALPSSGKGFKSPPGLASPSDKASDPGGCPPQGGSGDPVTPAVTLRGDRSWRKEGGDDLFDSLRQLNPASPESADSGMKLAGLPVIPEGGSDDELLADTREDCGVTAGDKATPETAKQSRDPIPLHRELKELSGSSPAAQRIPAAPGGEGGGAAGAAQPVPPARGDIHSVTSDPGLGVTSRSGESRCDFEKDKPRRSAGVEEGCLEPDFSELAFSSPSLLSPSQHGSASPSFPSDTPNHGAESPEKPTAEGSADKAGNSGKKKLLQAWVSPSETFPKHPQQRGETLAPKHRLHPVKPMNTTANKSQSKNLNVISTMNEKLLEMNVKKYDPSDPAYAYAQLTHSELIQLVLKQKDTISKRDLQVRELEDYIDNLLVRVMEETPNILRVSMAGNKKAGKM